MKLAVLCDSFDWAYGFETADLIKYLTRHTNIVATAYGADFFFQKLDQKTRMQYDCIMLYPRYVLYNPILYPPNRTVVKFSSFGDYSRQKETNTDQYAYVLCTNLQIQKRAKRDLPHLSDRILYVPLAIDTEKFYPTERTANQKLVIGFAGSKNRKSKRYDLIVDAVRGLEDVVEFKTAARGVEFVKHDEMYKFYNQLDLLVCMSEAEGGPLTSYEAGCCGIPTITGCKQSAIFETIEDNKNGFVVEQTSQSLKTKILELVSNRELVRTCSKNILSTMLSQHTWDLNWKTYYDIFMKVVG